MMADKPKHIDATAFLTSRRGLRQPEEVASKDNSRSAPVEQVLFDISNEQESYVNNFISQQNQPEINSSVASFYEHQYLRLKKWVFNSLDIYKVCHILYSSLILFVSLC